MIPSPSERVWLSTPLARVYTHMMIWTVKPALQNHVNRIAQRMRQIDQIECRATGREPKQALRHCLIGSTLAWTVLLDDKPVAMFGVLPLSIVSGRAAPWFLATDEIERGARQWVKWGAGFIAAMQSDFPRLENIVSVENRKAIRVLKALGFAVGTEIVIVGGVAMVRFSKG